MALARCDDHRPDPIEPETVSYALPLGYPGTAVTCDVVGCENPAPWWSSLACCPATIGRRPARCKALRLA